MIRRAIATVQGFRPMRFLDTNRLRKKTDKMTTGADETLGRSFNRSPLGPIRGSTRPSFASSTRWISPLRRDRWSGFGRQGRFSDGDCAEFRCCGSPAEIQTGLGEFIATTLSVARRLAAHDNRFATRVGDFGGSVAKKWNGLLADGLALFFGPLPWFVRGPLPTERNALPPPCKSSWLLQPLTLTRTATPVAQLRWRLG